MAEHSILNSDFPVTVPHFPELLITDAEFVKRLESVHKKLNVRKTGVSTRASAAVKKVDSTNVEEESPFIAALHTSAARVHTKETLASEDLILTENGDVAHLSSLDALVDLFYKLSEDDASEELLQKAWDVDPTAALKIIFNARSIHLGKSSRIAAYRSMGWLYKKHPMTFLVNLPWLVRPVVMKPKPKKDRDDKKEPAQNLEDDDFEKIDAEDDDFVLVVPQEGASFDSMALDRQNGLAHGYWKDLLNMLALAAQDYLKHDANPRDILNIKQNDMGRRRKKGQPKRKKVRSDDSSASTNDQVRIWNQKEALELRWAMLDQRYLTVTHKLKSHVIYQLFHVAVARLFATQLKRDLALLNSGDPRKVSQISLCAKWAPSLKQFHDKHTWIASSIAEILFTHDEVCSEGTRKSDRETYLKYARMNYQFKVLSPLRKALDVVERKITSGDFKDISYNKVPSLAMQRYTKMFLEKDAVNFNIFLDKVTAGEAKISGAVLLPSVMVSKVDTRQYTKRGPQPATNVLAEQRVLDLQWNTLVQRIKDSGKLESSIAVCDVSGSMGSPLRPDGTTPMHSAVGLSLLLSEICEAPFGGSMITFSEQPAVLKVGGANDKRDLQAKVNHIMRSPWGMSTDFVAVFSKLILPLAIQHKISPDKMVKQVFVFSDMQFNAAMGMQDRWTSSFERIKQEFSDAGYEMPTLIFWNLAAGGKGVPVKATQPGTALVGGYSQAQMKVFLDGGLFDESQADAVQSDEEMIDAPGNKVKVKKEKSQIDSVQVMRKAISHPGYAMLRVVD